ncbi:MAG TPA: hypothetical protein VJZ71_16925 [Phycisphaerae bacterium]|nr:hypothetical protein [Phycisphaerae bacterium]
MQRFFTLALLSASVAFSSGCTTMAKRAFKEAKGAGSDAEPVPGSGGGAFAQFQGVNIAAPRTDLGGLVNAGFMNILPTELRKHLTQEKDAPFKGSGATLSIEPEVRYFHKGGGPFPTKIAVVLYWLKADGADYGRIQVVTKSEATGTGDDDLAASSAKELASYLAKRKQGK